MKKKKQKGGDEDIITQRKAHLECVRGVVDAVDTKAVVQGEAGRAGGEQRQLQAFAGGLRRAGLAHQAVRSQLLHEHVAALLLQLQVARRRQRLLPHRQHLLGKKMEISAGAAERRDGGSGGGGGGGVTVCNLAAPGRRRLTSHAPWWVCVFSVSVQSGVGVSSWAQWGKVSTTGRFSSMPEGPQLTTGLSTVWLPSEGSLRNTHTHSVKTA